MNSAIKTFTEQTGFVFEERGEIGFGRNCVGIVNTSTQSYVAYETRHPRTFEVIAQHEVAYALQAPNAYHKGPYLAVLYDGTEEKRLEAIAELEQWISNILAAGYKLEEYQEVNTLTALAYGGSVTQKALGGGMNYEDFKKYSQK